MSAETLCQRVTAEADSPEPMALGVDIFNASTALEDATYATDSFAASEALETAAQWLRRAQTRASGVGDETFAMRAACVAATLESWAELVPASPADLAAFQQTQLAPYQGVLSRLATAADVATHAYGGAALALGGVLGALLFTVAAQSWIDWKQTHGGYRGPRATPIPLATLRY